MLESAEEFIRLRYSENSDDYYRAAHEEASIEVWLQVIASYPDARFWVAQNKTVPAEVLSVLARDLDPSVRGMVARKNKLTPELLALLADDPDGSVRLSVAHHKGTPLEVLRKLSSDEWDAVRQAAGERVARESSPGP